jgi:teichuronic acid biosynthesis glycosyltransferase TuaG
VINSVSIISPSQDADSLLLRCAKSAHRSSIRCTDTAVEHIFVIDGGNDDETIWQQITDLEDEKYRVRKISLLGNRGVAFARNEALRVASGNYVMFLDADDSFEAPKITEQIKLMEQQRANFSYTGFIEFSAKTGRQWPVEASESLDVTVLKERCPICTSSVCISRDWLVSVMGGSEDLFPHQRMRSDWLGWYKIAGKDGFKSARVAGYYVRRQVGSKSLTANKFRTITYNYRVFRQTGHSILSSIIRAVLYPLDSLRRRIFN